MSIEIKIPTEDKIRRFIKTVCPKPDSPTEVGYVSGFETGAQWAIDKIKKLNEQTTRNTRQA